MCGSASDWDSRTVVANLNHNAIVVAISSDPSSPCASHRVDGIVDNVRPYLVQVRCRMNSRAAECFSYSRCTVTPRLSLVIQDGERVFQPLDDVHVLDRSLVHVGVFLDCADQVGYSRSCCSRFIQQVRNLDRSRDPHQGRPGRIRRRESRTKTPALPAYISPRARSAASCHKSFCPWLRNKESICSSRSLMASASGGGSSCCTNERFQLLDFRFLRGASGHAFPVRGWHL